MQSILDWHDIICGAVKAFTNYKLYNTVMSLIMGFSFIIDFVPETFGLWLNFSLILELLKYFMTSHAKI